MSPEHAPKPSATWIPHDESLTLCSSLQSVMRMGPSHQYCRAVERRPRAPAGPWKICSSAFLQDSLAREEALTARWAWWPTSMLVCSCDEDIGRGHRWYPGTGGPSGALVTHLLLAKTKGSSSPSLQPKSIPLRLG